MSEVKLFPILVPGEVLARAAVGEIAEPAITMIVCAIPWSMIAPFEFRVRRHNRTRLTTIMARGGLDAAEAVLAIEGEWLSWRDANLRLGVLVAQHEASNAQAA